MDQDMWRVKLSTQQVIAIAILKYVAQSPPPPKVILKQKKNDDHFILFFFTDVPL